MPSARKPANNASSHTAESQESALKPKVVSDHLIVIPKLKSSAPIDSRVDIDDAHPAAHDSADLANLTDSANRLGRFRNDPISFMMRLTAQGSAFYLDYIGQRILHQGYTNDIISSLLASHHVTDLVDSLVADHVRKGKDRHTVRRQLRAQVKSYTHALVADMSSKRTLRFIAFVVNNLLVRMYHQGIYIKGSEWLQLRTVAKTAEKNGVSMLFLPCHKSHVDYLVISYLFYRLGIALPHIAAGQNLNIPVVGSLLKKGGAFFIRRSFGNDPVYSAVFKAYFETLLQRGHNVEAFIEGTRSRTGKLIPPKYGILKLVLESIQRGAVKDVMIVPMSIGYDKVIETSSYVSELLGRPKQPESLSQLVSSTSVLQLKLGRIDVRFAQPFSLRSWVETEASSRNICVSSPTNATPLLLRALGYRILSDINAVAVVMPSSLIGTIILTLRGRGVGRHELISKVDWLRNEIAYKGGKVAEFGDPTDVILDRVLKLLGSDLIGERAGLLETVYFVKRRFELSLYRNQCLHLFVSESILCLAVEVALRHSRGKMCVDDGSEGNSLILHPPLHLETSKPLPMEGLRGSSSYKQLLGNVTFLSQLLKREFVYPPGGISDNMNKTLKLLTDRAVLQSIDTVADRDKFDFYCFLIWPFVETYWLAGISLLLLDSTRSWETGADQFQRDQDHFLFSLFNFENSTNSDPASNTPGPCWYLETTFTNLVQEMAKSLYYEGYLSYFESINKEILKNAWSSFQEAGMIEYQLNPAAQFPHPTDALPNTPSNVPYTKPSFSSTSIPGMGGLHVAIVSDWHPAKNDRLLHFLTTLHRFRRDKDNVAQYARRAGLHSRVQAIVTLAARGLGPAFKLPGGVHRPREQSNQDLVMNRKNAETGLRSDAMTTSILVEPVEPSIRIPNPKL